MGKLFDRLRASRGHSNMYIDNDRLDKAASLADQRMRQAWEDAAPFFKRNASILVGANDYDSFAKKWHDANNAIQNADVTLTAPERALPGIFGDQRFKNQFETGTSMGALNNSRRRSVEYRLGASGFSDKSIDAENRPKYAYIGNPHTGKSGYGANQFLLKPEVKENMTYTIGDSLDDNYGAGRYGVDDWTAGIYNAYDSDDINEYFNGYAEDGVISYINDKAEEAMKYLHGVPISGRPSSGNYMEGQIWGPLGLGDVQRLRLTDENYLPMARQAARDFGFRLEHPEKGDDNMWHWKCLENCEE